MRLAFDLAILSGVLEHLKRSDGQDVLDYLYYQVGRVVVVFPVDYAQGYVNGNPWEAHVSAWTQEDFARFSPVVHAIDNMVLVMFDGLRERAQHEPEVGKEQTNG